MDLSTSYTIKAKVEGQNQIGKLETGLNKLKVSSNNTAAAMGKLKTAAGTAFSAFKNLAPAIGVAGLGKLVNDTLQLGDSLEKMSQKTGVAVPVLDKLRQAADLGGTEFKTLSRAFPTLAKNMQDASDGVGTAKEAFDRLGLGVTNADGSLKSLDTMFFEITDKIKNMNNRTLAAANASEIFGTGMGAKLIPIMNQGSEAIQNLSTGFTQLSAERMAKFNDNVAQMGEKFNVLKVQLTEAVLPIFSKFVEIISSAAQKFAKLPGPVKAISVAFALIAPAVIAVAPVIAALIVSFKTIAAIKMGVVIAKITTAFGGVLVAVKSAILGFAPLLAGAAIPAAIIGLGVLIFKFRDQIGDSLKAVGQFFVNAFSPLTNFIGNVFNGAMDLARNAFNRLPNIVQEAIKFATAPLRSFVNLLKNILSMLGIVRDGTSNLQKPPSTIPPSDITTTSIPQTSNFDSTIFTAPTTSTFTSNPATSGLSSSNFNSSDSYQTGLTTTGSTNASDDFNNQSSATTLTATELPNGTFLIEQKPKPPNITIETGNVVQIDNTNYVTTDDLVNAVSNATTQTLNYIQAGGVKYYL